MKVSVLTLILLTTYLALVKLVAFYAHKHSESTSSDYFITSRGSSSFILVGTILATMINTLAVSGVPALVYKGGILYLQMFVIGIIAPTLIAIFGTKIWNAGKRHGYLTQAELFGGHYKSNAVLFVSAIIGLFSIFPFMAIQLSAIGKVFSSATGGAVSYDMAVLLSSTSIGIYLYYGGSRAVVWTDAIQAFFFLAIIVVSAVLFTKWAGGYAVGVKTLTTVIPHKLSFNAHNTPVFIDNILSWPFAFFLWPQLFQRMYMAKSEKAIRQSIPWNYFLFNSVVLCTMTMGIMGTAALYGTLQDPDQLVASMYQRFFPLGGALIVIAVFATGMSTIDSILLTSSSILSQDLIQSHSKRPHNEKACFQHGRRAALLFLILVTVFALSSAGRGAMAPLVTLGASFATLFLWPLIGTFFFCWVGKATILTSMSLGSMAILVTKFSDLGAFVIWGPGTSGFLAGGSCFLLGAIIEKRARLKLPPTQQRIPMDKAIEIVEERLKL